MQDLEDDIFASLRWVRADTIDGGPVDDDDLREEAENLIALVQMVCDERRKMGYSEGYRLGYRYGEQDARPSGYVEISRADEYVKAAREQGYKEGLKAGEHCATYEYLNGPTGGFEKGTEE